ncbi:MAG TPA: Rieske 2Fe-2S domain-containing protein, partial [Alphaproteobacteria bacterium]|nr:Rieske 2Fe-2S domain-containing protein [Alphaproteobacteria bacterium]
MTPLALSPALPPAAYCDDGWFEKEKNLLFRRTWQFFTFASRVAKANQFVARKLFGIPVVVQNCAGQLRAFENICLHRQALIQDQPHGCRPLACPYHGWNYNAEGKVTAIPFNEEYYHLPPEKVGGLHLRRFGLEKIGDLIFVNLSDDPIPIARQFAPALIDDLADLSSHFDDEMIVTTFRRRFNWKLIFENLRDGLHPAYLHRNTLYKNVKFKPSHMPREVLETYLREELPRAHSNTDPLDEAREFFSRGGPDTGLEKLNPYPWHRCVTRYKDEDCYYNWLLFPNLHIASGTGGYSFIIEHYLPQSAGATDVDVYYMTAKKKQRYAASKAVLYE